jgi:formate dehydrogenase maturation protein FdhE
MMESSAVSTQPWTDQRRRAQQLLAREEHAAGLLRLYAALTEAWTEIAQDVSTHPPGPTELADYVATRAMPRVLDRTLIGGPAALREAVVGRFQEGDPAGMVRAWLAGYEQPATDRYLARASASPVLETVRGLARSTGSRASDPRHCPNCGGLPQLSSFGISDEALVTAPRSLLCSRCAVSWAYPRMLCAGCGNDDTSSLPIYSDHERFASLRLDACEACHAYLVTVDRPKDRDAVPVVDELVALPLDLYARERGFHKITPNLMGF